VVEAPWAAACTGSGSNAAAQGPSHCLHQRPFLGWAGCQLAAAAVGRGSSSSSSSSSRAGAAAASRPPTQVATPSEADWEQQGAAFDPCGYYQAGSGLTVPEEARR